MTQPLYADRFSLAALSGALANTRTAVQASDKRFWSSVVRSMLDPTRDVVEIRFAGPRQINFMGFKTAHFPHVLHAEWRTEDDPVWRPFTDRAGKIVLSSVVTDSVPSVITGLPDVETGHPQHTMAPGHWVPIYWAVAPVEATRVRLVMQRGPGVAPTNPQGKALAYSLGIRDWQVGYRVNSAADIPNTGIVQTEQDTYGSTMDLLGSRVVFSTKRDGATNVIAGDNSKFWRSEPQPVSYAVVNFFADLRDAQGNPQTIDRFYLDPLTVGPTMNVYWSNDDPDAEFEPDNEYIPFGSITEVGNVASVGGKWLDFEGASDAHVTVNNDVLMLDAAQPWWLAMAINPQFDSTDVNIREFIRIGNSVLRWNSGVLEWLNDDGTLYLSDPLPTMPRNADVRIVLAYNPTDTGVGRGYHVYWTLGEAEPYHLITAIRHPPVAWQALQIGGALSAFRLRSFVLKPTVLTDDDITWFNFDPDDYPLGPSDRAQWPGTAGNALLRFHPSGISPQYPLGFVGGPGNRFAGVRWTPVMRDYAMKQGYLFLPPTRAKFWKFEITNLVPEHYEVFVPIRRQVQMFRSDTVEQWVKLTNPPKTVPKPAPATKKTPAGLNTLKSLASLNRYSDAVALLGLLGSAPPSYSPTETLYVRDPGQAQKAAATGWVWNFQPWHIGSTAPRFVETQKHVYETVTIDHQTKVGFFAGIRRLRAYRVDYLAQDDTDQYVEHFHDDLHIASTDGVGWPDGALVSDAYTASVQSKVYGSHHNVYAVQFATIQSEARQVLDDEWLRELWRWSVYGDAMIGQTDTGVHITRGFYHRTYGQIESQPDWMTYGAMDGHLYGEIEGGQVNGLAGGGVNSEPYLPSTAGKVYAAARVSAPSTLRAPIEVQVVDAESGIVLASSQHMVSAGETVNLFASYTPGSVQQPLTWGDLTQPVSITDPTDLTAAGQTLSRTDVNAATIVVRLNDGSGTVVAPANYTLATSADGAVTIRLAGATYADPTPVLVTYDTTGGEYADLEGRTYGSFESRTITGEVYARVVQIGPTQDEFDVQRVSIYDDPITWEFSVDGGTTWYDSGDIRNNPHGVLSFPEPGAQLCWRMRLHRPGAVVSGLAIRPWYSGLAGPALTRVATLNHGPNRNVADDYPDLTQDPMWQQWDQPIPRSFYNPPPTLEATPAIPPPPPITPQAHDVSEYALNATDTLPPINDFAYAVITGTAWTEDFTAETDRALAAPYVVETTAGGVDARVYGGALSIPNGVPESVSHVLMSVHGDSQYADVYYGNVGPAWTDGNWYLPVQLRWTDVNNHITARVVLTPDGYLVEVWDYVNGVDTRLDYVQLTGHATRPNLTHLHAEVAGSTVIVSADFADSDIGTVQVSTQTAVGTGPQMGATVNYQQRINRLDLASHI